MKGQQPVSISAHVYVCVSVDSNVKHAVVKEAVKHFNEKFILLG